MSRLSGQESGQESGSKPGKKSAQRDLSSPLVLRLLPGQQRYEPVWQAMQDFTNQRNKQTADEIWLLQHAPVFTQGQAGKPEHLLATGDIPVVQVDRGGQVTYHGPGQLVAYLLLDIARLGIGARELVTRIENSIIRMLGSYDLTAAARPDAPGVYIGDAKIASIGLRIRKGCSFHGLALNVNMDLEPFHRINPCGYQGMQMLQLASLVDALEWDDVQERLIQSLCESFGYRSMQRMITLPENNQAKPQEEQN